MLTDLGKLWIEKAPVVHAALLEAGYDVRLEIHEESGLPVIHWKGTRITREVLAKAMDVAGCPELWKV